MIFLNFFLDYHLINEIRITTDTEPNSACPACLKVTICQGLSCCTTSSQLGQFDTGSISILSGSQLGDCVTKELDINSSAPIDVTINHVHATDGWKGKIMTIHTSKAFYQCLITKWLDSDDSVVEPTFTTQCEKQTSSG